MNEVRLGRRGWAVVTLVVLFAGLVLLTGVTGAFGTGARLELHLGNLQDGAAADTFWDSPVVDVPGVSLTAVHCHGWVRYELQAGATGPPHSNPCYAALAMYNGTTGDWGTYLLLPGDQAVYRISLNYQPWRYCVGPLIHDEPGPNPVTPC